MNHTEILDKIFELRKKIGFKQEDMAGMIGVDRNTLSRWENGKSIPHKVFRKKMEEILAFRPRRRGEKSSDTGEKNK
ncbi:hypothetical protein ES708_02998 [subsurface metagenome]